MFYQVWSSKTSSLSNSKFIFYPWWLLKLKWYRFEFLFLSSRKSSNILISFSLFWTIIFCVTACWGNFSTFSVFSGLALIQKWTQDTWTLLLLLDYATLTSDICNSVNPKWFLPDFREKMLVSLPIILRGQKGANSQRV